MIARPDTGQAGVAVMWLRFDDNYPNHPKVIGLSSHAFTLNTCAICYAGRHHTDGFLPAAVVPRLWHFERGVSVSRLVRELLDARLWEEVPGGYRVHDFLDYQPSAHELDVKAADLRTRVVRAGRARAAGAPRRSGRFSKGSTSDDTSIPPASHQQPAGHPLVPLVPASTSISPARGGAGSSSSFSTQEVQTEHERKGGSDSGLSLLPPETDEPPAFSSFWLRYPRKRGKQAALAVWTKLRVGVALAERIFAAVERDCVSPEWVRDGGRFIPEPAKWLRGKRWEDEGTALPTVSEATAHNAQVAQRWLNRKREG